MHVSPDATTEGASGTPASGGRGRLVLVSNRLPIAVTRREDGIEVRPSSGGLATGLRGVHARGASTWVGWPGTEPRSFEERTRIDRELAALNVVPVHFSNAETERFYEGVANGVIWPLFHYLLDRVPSVINYWEDYVAANERFADEVCLHAEDDDLIWVHDYQLLLLPAMLRARLPRARIGFFLHIPFPSSEVLRVLPRREAVLQGLLGADLIGFHTFNDQRHFSASLLSLLGLETEVDRVEVEGRSVQLRAFPMGIDGKAFEALAGEPSVLDAMHRLRAAHAAEKLVLGVDRLDYTKGLIRKFLALELLLERRPEYRGKVRLLQIAVPSRENVSAYRDLKREIEEIAGRINGAYGTLHSAPIHYVYDSVNEVELTGSYRAADVMLVTPLRDGMNLVAKEYVASRIDGDGVLVLSEFAGAAGELAEALIVNPYDVETLAATLVRALEMSESERRMRMAALRSKVALRPVELWADGFIATLGEAPFAHNPRSLRGDAAAVRRLARELADLPRVFFALDYDGTLTEIRDTPEAARPDAELSSLIAGLVALDGVQVSVVSGRRRESLQDFLGEYALDLVAEHGVWTRRAGGDWICNVDTRLLSWREPVLEVLRDYTLRTPGSWLEEKTAGLAWHYRNADRQLGATRAKEVRLNLIQFLAQQPATVLAGRKVVEVRPQGVDKGTSSHWLLEHQPEDVAIVAMGDDRGDEELFRALPAKAYTFAAGPGPTRARYRLDGPRQVRALLAEFLAARRAGDSARSGVNAAPPLEPEAHETRPSSGAGTPEVIALDGETRALLRSGSPLESALARYVPARRWFRSKSRRTTEARLVDAVRLDVPDAELYLVFVEIGFAEGEPELYALPVAREESDEPPPDALLGISSAEARKPHAWLVDASRDARVGQALHALAISGGRLRGRRAELRGSATETQFVSAPGSAAPRSLDGEQTNTSYVVGPDCMGKMMRKIEDGRSLELDVLEHLEQAPARPKVPRLLAQVEVEVGRASHATLWMSQTYVKNEGDAWQVVLDGVQRFFEHVLSLYRDRKPEALPASLLQGADQLRPPVVEELLGDHLRFVELLGKRTAELHLALAHDQQHPKFAARCQTDLARRSHFQSLRQLATRAFEKLAGAELTGSAGALAERVLARESEVRERLDRMQSTPLSGSVIRVHGDYHLGQVLCTERDVVIIDFEGEPGRSRAERERLRSPVSDLAGMLRSFHYAAFGSLTSDLRCSRVRDEDRPVLEPWAAFHYQWSAAEFLHAYLTQMGQNHLLPATTGELELLLELHLLEKALSELSYELDTRPEWIELPLRGLLDILDERS